MIYKEEVKDLFTVPEDYYLAHCISADFGMGKGIVVEFNKRFDMKNNIKKIAMPVIGCGLDRLNWADVSEQIKSVFTDTDVEILVCKR